MRRNIHLLYLFTAVFGLVATGTAIVVVGDYLATLAYYQRVANGMAQVVDVNLRRLVQGAEVALARTTDLVQAAGGSANTRDESAWRHMRSYLDAVMGGDSIWIVDRHGDVVLQSSAFPGNTTNVADRAYFEAGRRDTTLFIGPAIASRFTDRIVVTLTRGLLDSRGEFDGIVGITIEADWLIAFYALLEPEMDPDIAVLRGDGSIVIANRDLAAMIGGATVETSRWHRLLGPVGNGPLTEFDAEERLIAQIKVPAYDISVAVRIDPREALARWQVRTRNTAVVAVLGAIALSIVMLLGIRSFERERIALAAVRQAASDLAMARHDTLTGLASRGLFFELSAALAAQAARRGNILGALYIDLDGFKLVNDRLGHDRGDQVLVETARAIDGSIRDADVAGRIGGDEFVVCLAGPPGVTAQAMRDVAERIRAGIAAIGDGIACSIGMAQAPAAGANLHALMRQADGAMRQAKAQGKNQVVAA